MGKGKGAIASWLEELLMQFHTVAAMPLERGIANAIPHGGGGDGGGGAGISPDGDLRGPIPKFLEGGVLEGIFFVFIFELLDDGLPQHALSLSMDEDDFAPFFILVLLERASEDLKLVREDVSGGHAGKVVEQLRGM